MKRKVYLIIFFLLMSFQASYGSVIVVGGLTHEKSAKPSDTYEGILYLKNDGDEPSDVRLYLTDYKYSADGKSEYEKPGTEPRSNAEWITFSPQRLIVAPKDTAPVNYTVKVPGNADMKGTYWSMLMVEPLAETPAPDVQKSGKEKAKVGIQTVIRYGIQMITQMPESGEKKLSFPDKRLLIKEGRTLFQLDVANTGERSVSPLIWAELYNKDGAYIGRYESKRLRILPGCSVRHEVDFTGVPKGDYKALVVADNGDENVFGAEYNLSIK
ncbi:MAG: hypothetical protein AB9903_31560 [Vulcanimicrobiota bacterium]